MRNAVSSSDVTQTRQRILGAAALMFARHGFQGATTREIANEAGVNQGTLFRHFNVECAAAILRDCLQAAALRHSGFCSANYSAETYTKTLIAIFLGGIEHRQEEKQNE